MFFGEENVLYFDIQMSAKLVYNWKQFSNCLDAGKQTVNGLDGFLMIIFLTGSTTHMHAPNHIQFAISLFVHLSSLFLKTTHFC